MSLLKTPQDWLQCLLRLALGLLIFPHGAQKLLGMFGGSGFAATTGYFSTQLGVPAWLTTLVVVSEFVGGLLLVGGLFSRVAAALLIADMVGAMLLVNFKSGFFWTNGGVEYPLLLIVVALAIVIRGGGALSADRALAERQTGSEPSLSHSRLQP